MRASETTGKDSAPEDYADRERQHCLLPGLAWGGWWPSTKQGGSGTWCQSLHGAGPQPQDEILEKAPDGLDLEGEVLGAKGDK